MTLHEIEETLRTLASRHVGLNEGMLVTLLRSGGWEEKNIQEAVLLFRSGTGVPTKEAPLTKEAGLLPATEESHLLPPQADGDHLLLEHNDDVLSTPFQTPSAQPAEPQSLIETPTPSAQLQRDELPHNLPLRPFETSDHIWPFSRYRDIFFGEAETKPQSVVHEEKKQDNTAVEQIVETTQVVEPVPYEVAAPELVQTPTPVVVTIEKRDQPSIEAPPVIAPSPPVEKRTIAPAPLSRSDERLVIIAAIMLVAILLLLGYMYSNGRL